MDDLISRSALIEAIKTIKNECKEHLMCRDCPIYSNDKGCLIEPLPCDWEIRVNEDCVELYEKERETNGKV